MRTGKIVRKAHALGLDVGKTTLDHLYWGSTWVPNEATLQVLKKAMELDEAESARLDDAVRQALIQRDTPKARPMPGQVTAQGEVIPQREVTTQGEVTTQEPAFTAFSDPRRSDGVNEESGPDPDAPPRQNPLQLADFAGHVQRLRTHPWAIVALVLLVVGLGVVAMVSASKDPSGISAAPADVNPTAALTPTASRTPTSTSSTAMPPTAPAVVVRIVEPHRQAVNNPRFTAHGTAKIPPGAKLWLMVQPADQAYYLTNGVEPVRVDGNRRWSGEVGLADAKGLYDIWVVHTEPGSAFEAKVRAAVQQAKRTGEPLYTVRFKPLPQDASRVAHVRVKLTRV